MEFKVGRFYKWTVPFRNDCTVRVALREIAGQIAIVQYNNDRFPARMQDLTATPQFEQGDVVRYGAGWSLDLYEVDAVDHRRQELIYYVRRLSVGENGEIASGRDTTELRSESDLVPVKFYHVFGMMTGDNVYRWSRALWAKDAQEAEDECVNSVNGELDIAAVLRINGTIDEQY